MRARAKQQIHRPPRTFDEDLVDLANFFSTNRLSFEGIDGARLLALGAEQREERAEEGRALGAHQAVHQAFIRNQARRYGEYMQALSFARVKFRENSAKLKELTRFRRHVGRNGNGSSAPADPEPPAPEGKNPSSS